MPLLRNIKLLSWFSFLNNFRLYSVLAVIYFSQVTHSYALGISIFSIAQISQALFEIPTGVYSDRIGRSNCLKLGALASVLSVAFYAVGNLYIILVIGAILEGICRAFFSGNNNAFLYETLKETGNEEKYHEELGKVSSWLELAGFLGAIIGGIIAFNSFSLLMWVSVVPQIVCMIISFQFVEPNIQIDKIENVYLHLKDAFSNYKTNARLRKLSLATIIGSGVGESTWSFQSVFYSTLLPVWLVGFVMSLNYLASTISYRLSGKIIDKVKALKLLIYQEIYSRTLYLIALIRPTVVSPFLMAGASVIYGPGEVAKSTLFQKEFTDRQRATIASINSLVTNCFYAVFAILIGLLADRFGVVKSLIFAQICLLPVLLIYINLLKADKNQQREVSSIQ